MKVLRHLRWILPPAFFLLCLTPSIVGRWYHLPNARFYREPANLSCGLARGYAREYERQNGKAPSEDEFRAWAVARFSEAVRRMRFDEQGEAKWRDFR